MENQIGEAFAGLGRYSQEVEAALAGLQKQEVVSRIWRKDHTVWKPEPREITNRLGWLDAPCLMGEQIAALNSFAGEIGEEGFEHVVLLGMGGASLGAEVLHQTFGCAAGRPEFMVLDSTVPSWVRAVTEVIQPARTLFLVSSKSGGTIETLLLYRYFRCLVEETVGKERAGRNFVAITDAGTPLARLAEEASFRRVFLNPPDIGGRYSVLSYFGLVPAALMGIDLAALLGRADGMRQRCLSEVSASENPAAWLGATIGTLGQRGRDKLTLITSPSIGSFGLWLEQLIAESTGKEGKGILPVAGEPLVEPVHYGDDRLFICLRLEGDDNAAIDEVVERIRASGQPVVVLRWQDRSDLGAEFFRWELATAVVGAILGINPFDQPNVQGAKDATKRVLEEYQASGRLPAVEASGSLGDLLAQAGPGDYFAIMAYMRQTLEMEEAIASLRRKVLERYHISTTAGYGPRLLHSTGQLHKGGPNSGLFLMVTIDHKPDLAIPGEPYTFGVLADAQALGDLQTLRSLGRRVVRVHLGSAEAASFRTLAQGLG